MTVVVSMEAGEEGDVVTYTRPMSAGTSDTAPVMGSVRIPVVWMVVVAGIEPLGRIEPKMLGAVTLGRGPWMITSPSGPLLVMAGVKFDSVRLPSSELPIVCWVWIEPPSPRMLTVWITESSSWSLELKVSATVKSAITEPRATLLAVSMLAVPKLLAVLSPSTWSATFRLSKLPLPGVSSMKKPTSYMSANGTRKVSAVEPFTEPAWTMAVPGARSRAASAAVTRAPG